MRQFIKIQLLKVKQNKLKATAYSLLFAFISLVVAIFLSNNFILNKSSAYLFDTPISIPTNNVGLVLGTSQALSNGNPNLYFTHRINAAAQLYHTGKVKHLLVSGDNHIKITMSLNKCALPLLPKGCLIVA
jgi:SanA protein